MFVFPRVIFWLDWEDDLQYNLELTLKMDFLCFLFCRLSKVRNGGIIFFLLKLQEVRQNHSHSNSSKEWDFPWWPEQYQALLTNWWNFIFCFHSCKVSKSNLWPNLDLITKEFKVSECSLNDFASKWERFAKKVNPKELDQTLVWFKLKFESESKLILWLGTKTKL